MKIRSKISMYTAISVAAAILVTCTVILTMVRHDLEHQAAQSLDNRIKTFWELLRNKGSEFTVADGTIRVGGYAINNNFELPDKLKELWGGTATVFMGDTRVSTNVMKPDGSRAVGTKLQGPAFDAIFKEGKPYRGETKILGIPYLTAYDPIKDPQGKTIGVLYVGVKKAEFFATYNRLVWIVGSIATVLVLVSSLVIWLVVRGSMQGLNRAVELMGQVAGGNFSVRMECRKSDNEVDRLACSVNRMLDDVCQAIQEVTAAAGELAAVAEKVHGDATGISSSVDEVAIQTSSVAAAGEEMAATSGEIAHNCTLAAQGARDANSFAENGAQVVDSSINVMNRIADRVRETATTVERLGSGSDQIGAIVGTINEIADQTNLLALNAAIEAARAGEQGRGFAVVADEVRALAERTMRATREIAQMIKTIQSDTRTAVVSMNEGVKEVEQGTSEAGRSGAALQDILQQINVVTMQINQIATAAEEQTATTQEISSNIHRITSVVGSSAQGAQAAVSAADQMNRLAAGLQHLVQQFKLAT